MLYQLNRPFQAFPICFEIEDPQLEALLPIWFGSAWQRIQTLPSAQEIPFLKVDVSADDPLEQINNFVYDHTVCKPSIFTFHGGAVADQKDVYLFLASTTTGKTTLITYLTQNGYTFVDDDCIQMDINTLQILPYSSPIHLREGGYLFLQNMLKSPLPNCQHIKTPYTSRYTFMPENCLEQSGQPKAIFFLNRTDDPAVSDRIVKLSSSTALQKLFLSALVPYKMNPAYIRFFQHLVPLCYELTYHDAPCVSDMLLTQFQGGSK